MPREKSITELMAEKRSLHDASQAIIDKAREEKRKLSEEETRTLSENTLRMQEINNEVAMRGQEKPVEAKGAKAERFSLRRAILAKLNGTEQHDSEAVVLEEGRAAGGNMRTDPNSLLIPIESRAALTAAGSSVLVPTDTMDILLPLEANLVLRRAGALYLTGLRGNIAWPSYSGTKVEWEGETDEAADGAGTITTAKTFKPRRLAAYVDLSKQLLIQESQDVETMIRQSIATAIAEKIEATALGGAETTANVPDGLFTGMSGGTPAEFNWANVVEMETELDSNNALRGSLAYILHPQLVGKAKTVVKDPSGAGGLVIGDDANWLNGIMALRSTNMVSAFGTGSKGYGAVLGNWNDYFIGQWGAVELIVDPYTQATKGTVRLVVNSYWDMGAIRDKSFVKKLFDPTLAPEA